MQNTNEWVAIIYRLPSYPSRIRVRIWRKLKKYGAIYYQQGVALLPHTERFLNHMQELKAEIISYNGEAFLTNFSFMDKKDDQNAIEQFNENLRQDYFAIKETICKIRNEIEASNKANLLSLDYLEQTLSIIKKLKKSYETVELRDCFKMNLTERIDEHIDALLQKVEYYCKEFGAALNPVS